MAKNRVYPMSPRNPTVAPLPAAPLSFRLNASEIQLFDAVAQEHVRIAGSDVEYWTLDTHRTQRDPLYNEPIKRVYRGPSRVIGFLTYPENDPQTGEAGLRYVWSGQLWLARRELEDGKVREPSEGDIVRVWNLPVFIRMAAGEQTIVPGGGFFFDVTKVRTDGHLFDNAAFVGYQLDIERRSDDVPERRLRG